MRIILAAVVLLAPAAAAAPSFDCAKAATPVEKLICADSGLSAADAALAASYTTLTAAHPDLKDSLRDGQRQWLSARSTCLDGKRAAQIACLKQHYSERQAALTGPTLVACAKPVMAGTNFTLRCVAPNSPAHLTAVVSGKKGEYDAELAKLTLTANGKTASFALSDASIPFDILTSAVELMDVNFDGFDDVKLTTSTSAGPNMGYGYWLYMPKTGGFAESDAGAQLSGFDVTPDAKTKTIAVSARGSCCDWVRAVYAWKGSTLLMRSDTDSGQFSALDIPGYDGQICGSSTRHHDDQGRITRIDLELGATEDADCDKDVLKAQAKLLDSLKSKAKGYRIDAKDAKHFAIVFAPPRKPSN